MAATYEGRKSIASWRRPLDRPHDVLSLLSVQEDSDARSNYTAVYPVEIRDRQGPRNFSTVHDYYAKTMISR